MGDKVALDLRNIPPRERHINVYDMFNGLRPGEVMELVNDHDPEAMRHQICEELRGMFEWNPVRQGPSVWVVDIRKTSSIGETQSIENAMADVNKNGFNPLPPIH